MVAYEKVVPAGLQPTLQVTYPSSSDAKAEIKESYVLAERCCSFNLFGGLHRGYTPPSSGALTILDFGARANDSGLDLKSEKSWNTEIGLRGKFSWMEFEAAGFHLAIEDVVAARLLGGSAMPDGLESQITVQEMKDLIAFLRQPE